MDATSNSESSFPGSPNSEKSVLVPSPRPIMSARFYELGSPYSPSRERADSSSSTSEHLLGATPVMESSQDVSHSPPKAKKVGKQRKSDKCRKTSSDSDSDATDEAKKLPKKFTRCPQRRRHLCAVCSIEDCGECANCR